MAIWRRRRGIKFPISSVVRYVDQWGNGTLNVEAGGVVTNWIGFIGHEFHFMGTATISGDGSQWYNSIKLYVLKDGKGTPHVESGRVASDFNPFCFLKMQSGREPLKRVIGNLCARDFLFGKQRLLGDACLWESS